MGIEVRAVGAEALDEIWPLLQRFPTRRMSRQDWRWTLFAHPWADGRSCSHVLYANGGPVGFLGAIFSTRVIGGRPEPVCNLTSWIVLESHRYAAHLLLRPPLALRDHTLVNLTPSPAAVGIFTRLGFRPLERERLLLLPAPRLRELLPGRGGSWELSGDAIQQELSGVDRAIHRDLASSPAVTHVLLRRGGRTCYVVATFARRRGLPFAEIQYLGDREFFWENRLLAHAALLRAMGPPGLVVSVDRRFLVGRPPPLAVSRRLDRLYRPAHEGIPADRIDGLYSELMGLLY